MLTRLLPPVPKKIFTKDGLHSGKVVGQGRPCTLNGCNGRRYPVRWPDGNLTWPCSDGLKMGPEKDSMQII